MRSARCLARPAAAAAVLAAVGVSAQGALRTDGLLALTGRAATVDDIVGRAALVALAVLVMWLAVTAVLTLLAGLPGAVGELATRAALAVTPALLRRLVAVSLGVSVVGGASPAFAAVADPRDHASATSTHVTRPVEPGNPRAGTAARLVRVDGSLLVRGAYLGAIVPSAASAVDTDASTLPSLDRPADPPVVTVLPGDCLWDIAARRLGPAASDAAITAEWNRWHDLNRDVIGPDPDLVHPGQRLVQPG